MTEDFILDRTYQARVIDVVLKALMTDLKDPATGAVVWRVGDIVHVMAMVSAMLLADTDIVTSPAKLEEYCVLHAQKLRSLIASAKLQSAANGPMFESVTVYGAMQ